MGLQSSRIIWGKTKLPGTNPVTPIDLYDESNVVYISGNYAIYSVSSGRVDEDYRLFLCTAAETGGDFNPDDWKEQKGIKNWALEGHRSYKVNARIIKELHEEEYTYVDEQGQEQTILLDGVYLFKCVLKTPPDHIWHPECWKLLFQEVGLGYIARDHKDVYYNGKFHTAMYYIRPDAQEETDLEVTDFDEEWEYHFGDLMIYNKLNQGYKCYKYISNLPSSGTYADGKWEVQNNAENLPIEEYKANIAYSKNYRCIKKAITIYEQVICEYDGFNLKYNIGKYCVYKIDKDDYLQREIDAGERLYPNWYRDKIIDGEEIYGLFRAIRPTGNGSSFNSEDWELINYRDGHYVLQWIPVNNGDPYNVGDERIYYFSDIDGSASSIMGLSTCIKEHITPTMANCPINSEYWKTEDQNIESTDTYRLYRANRDIPASDNTHFAAKQWSIVTQNMKITAEYYGLVWQKFGNSGSNGAPYFAPLAMWGGDDFGSYSGWMGGMVRKTTSLDRLYPFAGNNVLEIGPNITGHFEYEESYSDDGYPIDLLIANGFRIYGVMMTMTGHGSPHGIVCCVNGHWYTHGENIKYDSVDFAPSINGVIIKNKEYLISADGSSIVGERVLYTPKVPYIDYEYDYELEYNSKSSFLLNGELYSTVFAKGAFFSYRHINGATITSTVTKTISAGTPYTDSFGRYTHFDDTTAKDDNTGVIYGSVTKTTFVFQNGENVSLPLGSYNYENRWATESYTNGLCPDTEFDSVDLEHMIDYNTTYTIWYVDHIDSFEDLPEAYKIMYNLQHSLYDYHYKIVEVTTQYGRTYNRLVVYRDYTFIRTWTRFVPLIISNLNGDRIIMVSGAYYQSSSLYYGYIKLTVVTPTGYAVYEIDTFSQYETVPSRLMYIYNDTSEIWFKCLDRLYKVDIYSGSILYKGESLPPLRNIQYRGGEPLDTRIWDSGTLGSGGASVQFIADKIDIYYTYGDSPDIIGEVERLSQYSYKLKHIYLPLEAFYRQPWCASVSGSPANKPPGLYCSGWFSLRLVTSTGGSMYMGSIGLCLPNFPLSLSTAEALGFYWLDISTYYGDESKLYGGTSYKGFEGW